MNFTKGDIAVGIVSIFITGIMVGMWLKPEHKFAACVSIPAKTSMMYQSRGDVAYWRNYTRSLPK